MYQKKSAASNNQKKSAASNLPKKEFTKESESRYRKILDQAKIVNMRREAHYKGTTNPSSGFIFQKKDDILFGKPIPKTVFNPIGAFIKINPKTSKEDMDNKGRKDLTGLEVADRIKTINNLKEIRATGVFDKRVRNRRQIQSSQRSLIVQPCGGDYIDDTTKPEMEGEELNEIKPINTQYMSNDEKKEIKRNSWKCTEGQYSSTNSNATSLEPTTQSKTSKIEVLKKKKMAELNSTNVTTLFGRANGSINKLKDPKVCI